MMGHTRAVKITMERMTIAECLRMVAQAWDAGFAVPYQTMVDAVGKREVARMHNDGLIEIAIESARFNTSMYAITDAGRAFFAPR